MKFQPNFTLLHIPLTQSYLVFSSREVVINKVSETLNLLTLKHDMINNNVTVLTGGLSLKIYQMGSLVTVVFNIESSQKARYIRSAILKAICTMQK